MNKKIREEIKIARTYDMCILVKKINLGPGTIRWFKNGNI